MSLGIAVADDSGVFLAIESHGANVPMGANNEILGSKIIELQEGIVALATGYLLNWLHVKHHYKPRVSVGDAAHEVTRLLKGSPYLTHNPRSFGLVSGIENGNPCIYRLSVDHSQRATFDCEPVDDSSVVQLIGGGWDRITPEQHARLEWASGSKIEIIRSVLADVPEDPGMIAHPIRCKAILVPGYENDIERFREPIRRIAYSKYVDEHYPNGKHLTHWLAAKDELGFSEYAAI